MSHRVLITDNLAPVSVQILEEHGIEADIHLKKSDDEIIALAKDADGWIIRSGTRISAAMINAADKLKVIGRAGVGVDNIDLAAATRKGVLVINAPDGNTISTAEHTCAMLMALARQIPRANASLREGKWDRKAFMGNEIYEKTLGIIGVGKIGQAVATRMKMFGMKLLGYDPLLPPDIADRLGVELVDLDELLGQSDFITIHAPMNDATRGLLNKAAFAKCKRGVRIVNCARGGIADEADLLEALESGQVGGAALDVYSKEPPPEALKALLAHPNVVATPHIAASTEEAQTKVAVQVTEQVVRALNNEPVSTPVNAAAIRLAANRDAQPFIVLADKIGQAAAQMSDGRMERVTVKLRGEVPSRYAEIVSIAALQGLFTPLLRGPVNLINAKMLADEMDLEIHEQVSASTRGSTREHGYTNLVELTVETAKGSRTVAGTNFGSDDPRLVRLDEYWFEIRPDGWLLLYKNVDRPGMLAAVGTILAEAEINIGSLSLGRKGKGSLALTAIHVDEKVPDDVLKAVSGIDGISDVRLVNV